MQWNFHRRRLFTHDPEEGWVMLPARVRDWSLRSSTPERAILEVLSEVDETPASFSFAAGLFEGLTTLRPGVVNSLLQCCVHNKAKQLFLFLARTYLKISWPDIPGSCAGCASAGRTGATPGKRSLHGSRCVPPRGADPAYTGHSIRNMNFNEIGSRSC